MSDPVSVTRDGHRTFFKWHRARRFRTDPVFTGRRILEGMALGASVEVDLVRHAGHGFAVLHDHSTVARETTGSGPSASLSAAQLRALHLRDNDGQPIADTVMLLEDLCALLAETPPHPDAMLQLDYKSDQEPLDDATVAAFARIVEPVAKHLIVSSGETSSVDKLTRAAPGIHIGYDPCHGDSLASLRETGDYSAFISRALADAPRAEVIYLAYPIVLAAIDSGLDIIDVFQEAGCRVDAYTINSAGPVDVATAQRLLDEQVDQITTDDPEGLAAALSQN